MTAGETANRITSRTHGQNTFTGDLAVFFCPQNMPDMADLLILLGIILIGVSLHLTAGLVALTAYIGALCLVVGLALLRRRL